MSGADLRRGWCPSLLHPMESGDGWLVRLRPRLGVITAAMAGAVAEAAAAFGNGRIEITNRANLQIRGLRPDTIPRFVDAMQAAGVADDGPAVLVSPLAGADPSVAAETLEIAESVARGLDPRAYPSQPVDARVEPAHDGWTLPVKFGVLIDGGGVLPLMGLSLDVTIRANGGCWTVNGKDVPSEAVASRAVALARELSREPRQVSPRTAHAPALGFNPYGDGSEGAVLLAPPFGQIKASRLGVLADLAERRGDGALRPTPWKSLAIAGVARAEAVTLRAEAEAIGLIARPADPRLGIIACAGAPGCLGGEADTQAAARALAEVRQPDDPPWHLAGCAKGCAHPGAAAVTLVGERGYFNLIRDGRAGDVPAARRLALAEIAALLHSVPA